MILTIAAVITLPLNTSAEEYTLAPTQTTVIQADGTSATNSNVVLYKADAEKWRCSQSKISGNAFQNMLSAYEGSPVIIMKFDASNTLEGKTLKTATLKFNSYCTVASKNSNVQIASIGTNWDATTATWNNTNTAEIMQAVGLNGNGVNVNTTPVELTQDVTETLSADEDNIIGFAIFTYTGREQEVSNITLTIEAIDASASSTYTIKYVDENSNELKTAESRSESIGANATITEEDKNAIYTADNTKKYIYDSDDTENKTVAADGSTVITVKFREAEIYNYTLNAVDGDGNVLKVLKTGTNFEAETFDIAYAAYINVDGTIYKSGKLSSDGKGYYFSLTLSENNFNKNITFTASDITNVVYFSEAEDIQGLTLTTNSNTSVRSSNGASAYAANGDVEFTTLPNGKYKLTTVICDASKNAGSTWTFKAGDENIFEFTAGIVNWSEGTSEEFELNNKSTGILLAQGGSANLGVDLIYIQKTGDAELVLPAAAVGKMDFNSMDIAVSSNASTDGDITEDKTLSVDGEYTVTISPKASGTTNNRFWSASTTEVIPQLRVYNGTITIKAATGKTLNKITFGFGDNTGPLTSDCGEYADGVWTGDAESVVFTVTAQARINSITVGDYVEMIKAANIAEMKALENGTEATLTLTDAKVTYYYGLQMYSIIEDATGAIKIDSDISSMIEGGVGSILNGTLTATLNKVETSGLCTLNLSDNTNDITFTVTEGTATPTATTLAKLIAEENKDANLLRYVKLDEGLDVETVEDDWGNKDLYLVSGETKLHINDCYYKFPNMMPEFTKFNSITGFLSASYNGTLEFNPYGEDYDAEIKPATVVENIAALKQLKNGTYAKLTLTNAQIKVKEVPMRWGDDYVVIEDETAGIQIDLASDYLRENFNELGKTFNGTLYCQYVDAYGTVAIGESDSTSYSEITYGEAEVVAKEISISDATTANYDTRLVTIKGVKTQAPPEGEYSMYPLITKDGKTLPLYDMFYKTMDMETGEYKFYDKCQVTGLIIQNTVGYDEETYEEIMGDVFLLTDIVETPQVYKQIENTYTLLPTEDVVTAAVAEGWVEHGGTYTTNKKGHYDPETGEAISATTMPGVGLKKGNAAKTFVTYVTGASKLTAYAVSTSSSVRYLVVTATSEDGSDVKKGRDGHDSSASCVVSLDLDKDKKYTIEYTGVDESDAGADVCLYGVRFEVPVTDGIQSIDSTVNVLGGDVYTVNGVKVRKAGESLNGLAKGLYIIGGKKVVVK